jgi:hypothetical protein
MFALTGTFYTFKVTGQYDTKTEVLPLEAPVGPDLAVMMALAEKILQEKSIENPTGGSGIKKAGTSWQFEWTGSKMDLVLDPTENPLEIKASFKHATLHRHLVQLHKAKGGFAFKLLAAALGVGLILLLVSGWFLGQASREMRKLRLIATIVGIGTFLLTVYLS